MYDIKCHLIYEHIWIHKPIKLQLKNADIFMSKQLEDDSKPIIQIPKKNELSVLQKAGLKLLKPFVSKFYTNLLNCWHI